MKFTKHRLADTQLSLETTQEPTNIIWENKLATEDEIVRWRLKAALIFILVIGLGFFSLFLTQKKVDRLHRKYPDAHCSMTDFEDPIILENAKYYALIEWYHHEVSNKTLLELSSSNLQCYCDYLIHDIGKHAAINKKFSVNTRSGEELEGSLC